MVYRRHQLPHIEWSAIGEFDEWDDDDMSWERRIRGLARDNLGMFVFQVYRVVLLTSPGLPSH